MENNTNIIKSIGLPEPFAVVFLTFSFILFIAPYSSGKDWGLFKIPEFTDSARKKLKIFGPIIFLFAIMLFVPMIHTTVPANSNNDNRRNTNSNTTPSIDIHNQVQQHIAKAWDLYKHANYEGAIKECDEALRLEPANQEAIQLREKVRGSKDISNRSSGH